MDVSSIDIQFRKPKYYVIVGGSGLSDIDASGNCVITTGEKVLSFNVERSRKFFGKLYLVCDSVAVDSMRPSASC